jgi:hypothetical protein
MSDTNDFDGITRVNVRSDGTRDVERVGPDHPVIGPLARLIEDQFTVEIIQKQLGIAWEDIDQQGLERAAFSVAEEIDYYYVVTRRPEHEPGA